jgi:hypothetical protein
MEWPTERRRVVLLLCDLGGKSRKEAAIQLGLPEGTVASRLARARAMLASRLARHGFGVSAGALAVFLSENGASASIPASLLISTVKMARFLGAGQAATAGVVSASVGALAEGALKAMLVSKLQIATAVIIMAATTSVGVGGVIYQVEATERASGQSQPSRQVESPVMKGAAELSEPSEKVKKRLSAIVCLKIEYPNASGQSSIIGVVMDRRGCILTACIPVEKAKKIRAVFRDGSVHDADSWITAPATGLAVVQLEKPLAQDQLVVKFAAPPSVSVGETVWIARMPGSGNRSNLVLDRSIVMRLDQRLRINPTLEKRVFKGIVHIDGGVDLGSPVLNREGELAGLCFLASEKGVGPATALSAERVEEAFNDLMKR